MYVKKIIVRNFIKLNFSIFLYQRPKTITIETLSNTSIPLIKTLLFNAFIKSVAKTKNENIIEIIKIDIRCSFTSLLFKIINKKIGTKKNVLSKKYNIFSTLNVEKTDRKFSIKIFKSLISV
jgi:hypothetical protein